VSGADRQQALRALDSARPYLARLDVSGHPEDVAADLVEGWSGVCTALRSLLSGSSLDGQSLVREVRQRELISLETGHALLEFHAARERAQRPTYRVTGADVAVARSAYQRFEAELRAGAVAALGTAPGLGAATVSPPPVRPDGSARAGTGTGTVAAAAPATGHDETTLPRARRLGRGPVWRNPLLLVVLAVAALAGGYFAYAAFFAPGPSGSQLVARGVELYRGGRRVEARAEFERVASANPRLAIPHVYLGRIAREEGDLSRANDELRQAVTLEPNNLLAQREMGQYLLAAGNPDLARRFLVRAVQIDSTDAAANGWLGCALVRLNNREVADRFLRRAGPGDWTGCVSAPVPPPGAPPTAFLSQPLAAPLRP
jgi:tetratricopeptide (TPR) repeat protein